MGKEELWQKGNYGKRETMAKGKLREKEEL